MSGGAARGQPGGRREVEGGEENIVYNSKSADSGLLLYNNIHMLAGNTAGRRPVQYALIIGGYLLFTLLTIRNIAG